MQSGYSCRKEVIFFSPDQPIFIHFIEFTPPMLPPIRRLIIEIEFDNSLSPYRNKNMTDPYLRRFFAIRNSILTALKDIVPVEVIPKQLPPHYTQLSMKFNPNLYMDNKHNKHVHFPRKDSFEISVDNFVVFSRLKTGEWPNIQMITEWALKVSEKLIDYEVEKEYAPANEAKKTPIAKADSPNSSLPPLFVSSTRQNDEAVAQTERPAYRTIDANKLSINYDPPLNEQRKSRYRVDEKQLNNRSLDRFIPEGVGNNRLMGVSFKSRLNQHSNRKRFESQHQTINLLDSKERTKRSTFTWHMNEAKSRPTTKISQEFMNDPINKRKTIDLAPITNQQKKDIQRHGSLTQKHRQDQPIPKVLLKLSESVLNCNRSNYDIKGDYITKRENEQTWAPLLCQHPLPLRGEYYFAVAIQKSRRNMIQLGVVPLSYYPKMGKPDSEEHFLSYNCNDGMIKDKRSNEVVGTSWRMGGQAAPKHISLQLRVVLDMEHHVIEWYIDDTVVASANLTKNYQQGCRMFISLYDVGDTVLFNDQEWMKKQTSHLEIESKKQVPFHRQAYLLPQTHSRKVDEQIQTSTPNQGKIVRQDLLGEELKVDFSIEQRKWNRNRRFVKREPTLNKEIEQIKWPTIEPKKEIVQPIYNTETKTEKNIKSDTQKPAMNKEELIKNTKNEEKKEKEIVKPDAIKHQATKQQKPIPKVVIIQQNKPKQEKKDVEKPKEIKIQVQKQKPKDTVLPIKPKEEIQMKPQQISKAEKKEEPAIKVAQAENKKQEVKKQEVKPPIKQQNLNIVPKEKEQKSIVKQQELHPAIKQDKQEVHKSQNTVHLPQTTNPKPAAPTIPEQTLIKPDKKTQQTPPPPPPKYDHHWKASYEDSTYKIAQIKS